MIHDQAARHKIRGYDTNNIRGGTFNQLYNQG
ncbi:Protein of unknown function [Pyronema omphalodes CBS 100304]|uniref:Uncharacterized protein n=1 Tax=Pyronema omphalodes (strain CBS 100304) TaxID=1076935 RepID=U4L1C1_PYROM|nr:Protein of unknown function [Pyronema omphalodes CBS 100304]